MTTYDITIKSRGQELITKEHIATHTNTILPPSYCFILRGKRSSSAVFLSQQLHLSVLLHVSLHKGTPTLKLKHFVSIQLLKRLLKQKERLIQPYLGPFWQVFTTHFVIKVMPTNCTTSKLQ